MQAMMDEAQIRETAYLFWLEEGQPQGRDQEHWLRAVEVLSQPKKVVKPARKVAAHRRAKSPVNRASNAKKAAK